MGTRSRPPAYRCGAGPATRGRRASPRPRHPTTSLPPPIAPPHCPRRCRPRPRRARRPVPAAPSSTRRRRPSCRACGGTSSKPLILIAVGLVAVFAIVLILYFTGVFGRRDSDPIADEWPPSSSSDRRSTGTKSWPDRGLGSTATTSGSWLHGRWCSGPDSITFGSGSWAMSSNRYGTYQLIGSQMTMRSGDGDSRIVTVLQIDSMTMSMSAPGQGSETLRRC